MINWFKKQINKFKKIFKNNKPIMIEEELFIEDMENDDIIKIRENTEEFPTLINHKIQLEKKHRNNKHKVTKKRKNITPTIDHKEKKSKKLVIKLPKNRKSKKIISNKI